MNKHHQAIHSIDYSISDYSAQLERLGLMCSVYDVIKAQLAQKDIASMQQSTSHMEFLLHVNTYLLIHLIDLAVISKNLLIADKKWESRYFSKQAYLTVYESLKKFSSSQKRLKELFTIEGSCREDFAKTLKELKQFKNTYGYDTNLQKVRNKIAGHIDVDVKVYFEMAGSLQAAETLNIISALLPIFSNIQTLTSLLVREEKLRLEHVLADQKNEIDRTIEEIRSMLQK